jgi:MFS family permease
MYQIENSGDLIKQKRRTLFLRMTWMGVGRTVLFLGLTSLLTDISAEMVNATLPLYLLLTLQLAPLQFGLIDGLYQGAAALVRFASGWVADRWQRPKELAATGYGVSALCKLALLLVGGQWTALASVVLLDRVGKGVRTPPRDAMIAANTAPAHLATAFGVHRAMDTAGALLGPLLAALLLALAPGAYDAVFVVSLCFALVGLAVIVLFVENPAATTTSAQGERLTLRTSLPLLLQPEFRLILLIGSLLALMTLSDSLIYVTLQRRLQLSSGVFPLLYVATAGIYMLSAIPVGRLADRIGRRRVLVVGYTLLALVYALLLLPNLTYTTGVGVLALSGLYYAATDGVLTALASAGLPAAVRTTGLGLLTTGTSLARLCSSTLYGALWSWRGPEQATAIFLGGLLISLVLAALLLHRSARETASHAINS